MPSKLVRFCYRTCVIKSLWERPWLALATLIFFGALPPTYASLTISPTRTDYNVLANNTGTTFYYPVTGGTATMVDPSPFYDVVPNLMDLTYGRGSTGNS